MRSKGVQNSIRDCWAAVSLVSSDFIVTSGKSTKSSVLSGPVSTILTIEKQSIRSILAMCHVFVLLDAAAKRDTVVVPGLIWCKDTLIVNFPSNADASISFVCLDCYARADCGRWWRKAYQTNILPPN